MSTKNLIPRADGEGGIGIDGTAWGSGVFNTGFFEEVLVGGSNVVLASDFGTALDNYVSKSEIFIDSENNVGIGAETPTAPLTIKEVSNTAIKILKSSEQTIFTIGEDGDSNTILDSTYHDSNGNTQSKNLMITGGNVGIDVADPEYKLHVDGDLLANDINVVDSEGNPAPVLTADKLGLATSAVLENSELDIQFKLLTDENRFVVGTSGNAEGTIASGWYRFNDFKVKGATDIGSHPINPVDTRIYSDENSFIFFDTNAAGNRTAYLVGGDEEVSANNALAIGISVKVDDSESPEDIEFVHSDGQSYSVINGNSDSIGTNGLPIRQGFQQASLGSNPSPLLIDGGSF